MSKSPPLYGDDDDSDLPPPYTLTTTTASSSSSPPSLLLTTPLTTHLATLSSRLSSAAAHHRASRDADAATRAVPHVADFLARLEAAAAAPPSANRRFPSRAELVLVPAAAVPRGWALSGGAERRRDGEIVRVGRVEGEGGKAEGKGEKGRGKGKGKGEKGGDGDWAAADSNDDDDDDDNDGRRTGDVVGEFDEWGRWNDEPTNGGSASTGDLMWWRDESMAMRVATHLRPAEKVVVERRQVQAAVEKAKEERKGWGWRRNKSDAAKTTPPVTSQPLITVEPVPGTGAEGADDRATMTVRADEVTFRKESELGVWESLNGFGIVITVHIRKP
jgi:hypothetical protein